MRTFAWHRNAVVFSLSVDTFMDGDGDGIGDFAGLCSRLDYLESLGIDAIWLGPSQPSPFRDDGYDVADYYGIDRRLGSSGDFAEFMREADGRGIRVLLDLVVNHTSDRHPWFRDACRSADSRYHDWYVWSRRRPRDAQSGVVFPGVQKTTWSYVPRLREWYFHRFRDFQPDLDVENAEVREEIKRIVGYWLRLGVAGFRVDAVPFLIEKPSSGRSRGKLDFAYLRELREAVRWSRGDAVLLGEANIVPRDDAEYFADGDGLDTIFNFWVNQHVFHGLATEDARPVARALRATANIPASALWAHFLRNHDELDLGRLPKDARDDVFAQFAPDPSMQLYGRGIRRRLAPMLQERSRIELAYSLLFALPGSPVLRYGEEIGMGENLRLRDRDAVRTPMHWAPERNGGFSAAAKPIRQPVATGPYGFEAANVRDQLRQPQSLLRWMIELIRVRKQAPEIGAGNWRSLPVRSPSVLALRYDLNDSSVVTVHNLGREPRTVSIGLAADERPYSLLDDDGGRIRKVRGGAHRLELESFAYHWFRVDRRRSAPN